MAPYYAASPGARMPHGMRYRGGVGAQCTRHSVKIPPAWGQVRHVGAHESAGAGWQVGRQHPARSTTLFACGGGGVSGWDSKVEGEQWACGSRIGSYCMSRSGERMDGRHAS
eukprot:scaffold13540_cov113-Isochrysis_galbana.AAC.1